MRITDLKLTNLRAIETAELRFQPGFNLIVGENGAGKTTVIEALAVCLSEYVRRYNRDGDFRPFGEEDVRVNADALDVECGFERGGQRCRFVLHRPRGQSATTPGRTGFVGGQPPIDPDTVEFRYADPGADEGKPLGVWYSTNRSVHKETWPRETVGGRSRAYEGALSDREVQLGYFAAWVKVLQMLGSKRSPQALTAVQHAVRRFLPGYGNLRLGGADDNTLMIDKNGMSLAVRQLSHGERGTLAIVLDLARRLGHANHRGPGKPAREAGEAGAVVLIDEIDLHLHPKWQREIVRKLTETFPRCQFIATTHSPQVIGEVEPDRIQIISDDAVYHPEYSFGFDSNRVLQDIMEAAPRTRTVFELLTKIKKEIGDQAFTPARRSLKDLIAIVGERDPEVTRIRTLLRFLDDGR